MLLQITRLRSVNRRLSSSKGVSRIDYVSDNDSDIEDPEDLRLTLSPASLSGDMVTLNGDLADSSDADSGNGESAGARDGDSASGAAMANGDVSSLDGSKEEHGSGNERENDRVKHFSGSADHNHNREITVSSPLRKRSSSSECSNDSNPREPVSRRTSHTLADAFLEQLPEVHTVEAPEPLTSA